MTLGEDRVRLFIMLLNVRLKSPACGAFGNTGLVPWVMTRGLVGLFVKRLVTITSTPVLVNEMAASYDRAVALVNAKSPRPSPRPRNTDIVMLCDCGPGQSCAIVSVALYACVAFGFTIVNNRIRD